MEWIDVNERLPEESGVYLVFTEIFGIGTDRYKDSGLGFWTLEYPVKEDRVTHWMPLPEPPK